MKVDQLSADLESGWTLPSTWYHDKHIFELERHRIFERSWQYIGRTEALMSPGDYVTATVGEVPIVAVRNERNELAGFVNVCCHRLAEVVQGSGHRGVLQCHYHAWTYDLDGRLVSAPRSEREACFELANFCLQPVRVESFGPFVFANVCEEGPSLAEQLGDLPERMSRDGLNFDELVPVERTEWEVAANWKVVVENFDECYHCAVAHPSFTRLMEVDPENYQLEDDAWWSRATTPLRVWPEGSKVRLAYDASGPVRGGQFAFLWPNFTLVQNPGQPNAMAFYFRPEGPERTVVVSEYFFGRDVAPELVRDVVDFNLLVGAEDQRLVESVQRGLRCDRVPQGRLMLDSEHLIQHFQRLVHRALSD
jgi:phenylpropionate dioxygenase-like ring-hydroxylating dioxygenase large terminal subunit